MTEQLALDSPQDNIQVEGPVECLGMMFPNDEKRREYFLEKLREKLQDPDFRKIEGFPIGSDEDILALSDPPYYTACPNPFFEDVIVSWVKKHLARQKTIALTPFASDITEGKGEHFYNVHTYHTKVPYQAIARFVLHYTQPGDVILDLFCGTGMTGLAVQACADSLLLFGLDPPSSMEQVGERLALFVDLAPAATHIAANYNAQCDADKFENECSL